jgi:hypothetical protein
VSSTLFLPAYFDLGVSDTAVGASHAAELCYGSCSAPNARREAE